MARKPILAALALLLCGVVAAGEIVVGNLQDLSGPTSVLGNAVSRGVELAVEHVNAAGGINGNTIKIVTVDTKGNIQEAIKAFNRMVDHEGAVAVIGPPVSNVGLAIAPITDNKKIPVIASFVDPRAMLHENGQAREFIFAIQPSSVQQAEILASYAMDKLGYKKVALLYDQSNSFAVSMVRPFIAYVKENGGEIVEDLTFTKADKDFRAQLNRIKDSGADFYYAPNYTQDMVLICKQAKQVGLELPMFSGLDCAPPFASLVGDPEAANNIYFANNFADSEPQLVTVWKSYRDKYNEDPINKVFLGYDKVTVLVEAIKQGGGATSAQITAGMNKINNVAGTTGTISVSADDHMPKGLSMVMYKIVNGEYEELGRYVPEKHK